MKTSPEQSLTTCPSNAATGFLAPLRGLNEYVYCPRLFHLMYVQGLFEESLDTLEGRLAHGKRLAKTKAGKSETENDEKAVPWRADLVREMILSSEELGVVGKFDVILEDAGDLIPVEVKHGPSPDGAAPFQVGPHQLTGEAWGNDQVQLGGQMALLREAGHSCARGRIYYQKTKTLVDVVLDQTLFDAVRWVSGQARRAASEPMPEPLPDSRKCIRCSLNHICLPDETLRLKGKLDEPRQLYPGRDDCGLLHLVTPGTHMGKNGEAVRISVPDEQDSIIPMKDIAHVCCWGHAQITTQAMLELADRGIGISWLSGGGWLRAMTLAPLAKNVYLRRAQYRTCDTPLGCLELSRAVVTAKIENQRVLIRRNAREEGCRDTLSTLKECRDKAALADSLDSLRGIEGYAAKAYWNAFPSLLSEKDGCRLSMQGRNRRPPKDPVNTLLSFGYTMLLRDFMTALHGAGMDPLYGFYHAIVPGRPALALDLMEAFRPLVVDSTVLRAVNEGSFALSDFVQGKGFCVLKAPAKKRWIKAYERRVDEMVTHPVFGYRLSYRRIFTLEARLLGRFFGGEIGAYRPLTTR